MTCGAVPRLVAAVCAARVRAQVTIATACGALGGVLWQGRLIKSARTHTVTMPRRRRSSPSTIRRLLRCRHAGPPRADASSPTVGGEPVSPEAAGPLPRARSQAETARSGDASHPRAALIRMLDWGSILMVVKPDTLIRWHRHGWRLFWWWQSRPGRPPIPRDLQRLIVRMAQANPTWGEERITNELRL